MTGELRPGWQQQSSRLRCRQHELFQTSACQLWGDSQPAVHCYPKSLLRVWIQDDNELKLSIWTGILASYLLRIWVRFLLAFKNDKLSQRHFILTMQCCHYLEWFRFLIWVIQKHYFLIWLEDNFHHKIQSMLGTFSSLSCIKHPKILSAMTYIKQ